MTKPASMEAYLADLPADQRTALAGIRARVHALVPDAAEEISYGLPAFSLGGRTFFWFAAWKAHCSVYPLTEVFLAAHAGALRGYRRTKGSLHFTPARPIPPEILDQMIRDLAQPPP